MPLNVDVFHQLICLFFFWGGWHSYQLVGRNRTLGLDSLVPLVPGLFPGSLLSESEVCRPEAV